MARPRRQVRAQQQGNTFVIKANYGHKPAERRVDTLKPGTTVWHADAEHKLHAIYEDHAELRKTGSTTPVDVSLDAMVGVDGRDPDPADPLGPSWQGRDDPVFALEDLPELIRQLERVRDNPTPVEPA